MSHDFITVVSGLPRSGTSMMMKMLEMGSMPIMTDNLRKADEDNPKGYYEVERIKHLAQDNSWLPEARGKAIKVVSPILKYLLFDNTCSYKIIFMLRDLGEIIASQGKMADRLNEEAERINAATLKQHYTAHLDEINEWLESQASVSFLPVNYTDVLSYPGEVAEGIQTFLEIDLDTKEMSRAIDKSLYRQRGPELPEEDDTEISGDEGQQEVIMDQLKQLGYL